MISLIWPYWDRQAVADRSCSMLAEHYAKVKMELIVADDGNEVPYRVPLGMPFPITVVRLPRKTVPMNPCTAINAAVAEARGEFIALSGADILHTKPVLQQLYFTIKPDKMKYAIAAVWHAEKKVWHCHSSKPRSDTGDVGSFLPPNADYHFMTMMHRSLWDKAEGFDEEYRAGCGYDDPDFVMRLNRAGAKFVRRDDLVVEHVRNGAHVAWPQEGFDRNRALFMKKWRT